MISGHFRPVYIKFIRRRRVRLVHSIVETKHKECHRTDGDTPRPTVYYPIFALQFDRESKRKDQLTRPRRTNCKTSTGPQLFFKAFLFLTLFPVSSLPFAQPLATPVFDSPCRPSRPESIGETGKDRQRTLAILAGLPLYETIRSSGQLLENTERYSRVKGSSRCSASFDAPPRFNCLASSTRFRNLIRQHERELKPERARKVEDFSRG